MLLVSKLIFGSGNSTWSNSDARGASSRMSSNSIIGRTSTWIPSSFKISRASAHKLCMAGSGDTNSWRTWVFLIRCAIEIGELRIDSGNARRPRRMVPTIVEKKLIVSVVKDDYTQSALNDSTIRMSLTSICKNAYSGGVLRASAILTAILLVESRNVTVNYLGCSLDKTPGFRVKDCSSVVRAIGVDEDWVFRAMFSMEFEDLGYTETSIERRWVESTTILAVRSGNREDREIAQWASGWQHRW